MEAATVSYSSPLVEVVPLVKNKIMMKKYGIFSSEEEGRRRRRRRRRFLTFTMTMIVMLILGMILVSMDVVLSKKNNDELEIIEDEGSRDGEKEEEICGNDNLCMSKTSRISPSGGSLYENDLFAMEQIKYHFEYNRYNQNYAFLDYKDPRFPAIPNAKRTPPNRHIYDHRVTVPHFMTTFSKQRLVQEMTFHLIHRGTEIRTSETTTDSTTPTSSTNNQNSATGAWSQRLVLEIIFYALTFGQMTIPPTSILSSCLANKPGWNLLLQQQPDAGKIMNPIKNDDDVILDDDEEDVDYNDFCNWYGVVCHDIIPSSDQRPRVEYKLLDGKVLQQDYQWTQTNFPTSSPSSSSGQGGEGEDAEASGDLWPAANVVTQLNLAELECTGTLPNELVMLKDLHRLSLRGNQIRGRIPHSYGTQLETIQFLDLSYNKLEGGLPWNLNPLRHSLQELWLSHNQLDGSLVYPLTTLSKLKYLDLSHNQFMGTIPAEMEKLSHLEGLFLEANQLTGTLVSDWHKLKRIKYLFLQQNQLEGVFPPKWCRGMTKLKYLFLHDNSHLRGTFPQGLYRLSNLIKLRLGGNQLTGSLPNSISRTSKKKASSPSNNFQWHKMTALKELSLGFNRFTGTLPSSLALGLTGNLTSLDIAGNFFGGTIPSELAKLKRLSKFQAAGNSFEGTLPNDVGKMKRLRTFNVTNNHLTGTVPQGLCKSTRMDNHAVEFFGCDAILCPPRTFHPTGAADNMGGCTRCPTVENHSKDPTLRLLLKRLGRTSCQEGSFTTGDMNSDGRVSAREALRLLYVNTNGKEWGDVKFKTWANIHVRACDLVGVQCSPEGNIERIDLTSARLCFETPNRPFECKGIPPEIGQLTTLEALSMGRRDQLKSTIPTEMGLLKRLRFLDMGNIPGLYGTIPTEFGLLNNLKVINLSSCNLNGTIPAEIFKLRLLEKFHMSANTLITGTLPTEMGQARRLKELMLARLSLHGTIPQEIAEMNAIENIELYGSGLNGTLPVGLSRCKNLKRLDAFNNMLSGTIHHNFSIMKSLQILHLKKNKLSGTLPSSLGKLQALSWIDVSFNNLSGTIPPDWANLKNLKDLRLGGNRIWGPIPQALCEHHKVNGGRTRLFGCDAILCPLGSYDATGFAYESEGCQKCDAAKSETTIYLGGTECRVMRAHDFLSMLYDVTYGDDWAEEDRVGWKSFTNDATFDGRPAVCGWPGVICEQDGTLVSLALPLSHLKDPNF